MEVNSIFKSVIVTGGNKEEIVANSPFTKIFSDATLKYRNFLEKKLGMDAKNRKAWKENHPEATSQDYLNMLIESANISSAEFREWQIDYVHSSTKDTPGMACAIVLSSPVESTRKRPYEIEKVSNKGGKRKQKTLVAIVNKRTGEEVYRSKDHITISAAEKKLKELYKNGTLKDNAEIRLVVSITDPVVRTATYVPSKNTANGKMILFGQIDADSIA